MNLIDPQYIEKLLPKYHRWETEGQPPFMWDRDSRSAQYYYDSYHDHIRQKPDGTYEFNIQTDGAPESDTWVKGTFVVEGGRVRIIDQKEYIT